MPADRDMLMDIVGPALPAPTEDMVEADVDPIEMVAQDVFTAIEVKDAGMFARAIRDAVSMAMQDRDMDD